MTLGIMEKEQRKPVHFILNAKSGKGAAAQPLEVATRIAESHGYGLIAYPLEPGTFEAQIDTAIAAAQRDGGTVVVSGGDGTIRSVAEKAAHAGVKLGVVASGTFNFFARNYGIPETFEAAFSAAVTGEVREVRLGCVNRSFFLINASLGLYAKTIRERERSLRRWGRDRIVAIISMIRTLLKPYPSLEVELVVKGQVQRVRTLSIFIGNNALQLRGLALNVSQCMKQDLLAVVILKPVGRWEMLRILWRGIAKTLEKEERLEAFCVDSLTIHLPLRNMNVALDGELFWMPSPLRVKAVPNALRLVLPPKAKE